MHDAGARRARPRPARARGSADVERAEVVSRPSSSEARQRIAAWSEELARQTRQHPVRSVAIALAAGYVVGGGLFSRLTARAVGAGLRIGLRFAVVPFISDGLVTLGERLFAHDPVTDDDDHHDASAATGAVGETTTERKPSDHKET